MSLDAYHRRQSSAESPQQAEYRLFGRVTGALIEAREKDLAGGELMTALDWNRRMWSTFATDCSSPENQLPKQTRAQIISLSIYVSKTTSKVARGKASIDELIELNRTIMQGLAQQAQAPAPNPQAGSSSGIQGALPSGGFVS